MMIIAIVHTYIKNYMKYIKKNQFQSPHLYLGSIRLEVGNNKLTETEALKLKSHPLYNRLVKEGILCPPKEVRKTRTKKKKETPVVKEVEVQGDEKSASVD